jgi:membrane protein implicated in regulation of membrane protease activity
MLIVALVMAVIGLAALVTAVVTSNEVIAWVCIAASVIGVVLLIIDAIRERQRRDATASGYVAEPQQGEAPRQEEFDAEYPEDAAEQPKSPSAEDPDRT